MQTMSKKVLRGVLLSVALTSVASADEPISLLQAYAFTLEKNQAILSKQSALDADREDLNQAWSRVLPNITFNGQTGKGRYSTKFLKDEEADYSRATVNLVQPVFSQSRFKDIARAGRSVERAQSEYTVEQTSTALETLHAYLDVVSFATQLQIARQELEDHQVRRQRLEAMLERGLATKVDLLETQSRFDEVRAAVVQAENELNVAKTRLEQFVGMEQVEVQQVDESLWRHSRSLLQQTDWKAKALANSLTVKTARLGLMEAQAGVEVRRGDFWPELNLRAEYGKVDSYETSIEDNAKVQLELTVPIYQGGATASALRAAQHQVRSSEHYLKDREYFVGVKTEETLAKIKGSYENIQAYTKVAESAHAYLDAAEKGLRFGLRGIYDVLDAKSRLYNAQRKLQAEIYANIKAQLELLYLTSAFGVNEVADFIEKRRFPE